MTRADVDEAIQKGLEVWSKVTPLTFTRISKGIADIMIAFRTRGTCTFKFWVGGSEWLTSVTGDTTGLIHTPVFQFMAGVLDSLMAPWESSAMPFPLAWVWVETLTLMRTKIGPRIQWVSPIFFLRAIFSNSEELLKIAAMQLVAFTLQFPNTNIPCFIFSNMTLMKEFNIFKYH